MPQIDKILVRGGTALEWTTANPVLDERELGFETDTRLHKWGNGVTAWADLPYASGLIPTIQEVLTEGNEVNGGTEVIFKNSFPTPISPTAISKITTAPNSLVIETESTSTSSSSNLDLSTANAILNVNSSDGLSQSNATQDIKSFVLKSTNPTYRGATYYGDYSANYFDRSLTDKAYVLGHVETASITGTKDIDWNRRETVGNYTLTDATTLTESNLRPRVLEFLITGDFALTLPSTWTPYPNNDAYDGTIDNHIVVTCIVATGGSEKIFYTLTNIA